MTIGLKLTSLTPVNLNQRNLPAVLFLFGILWFNMVREQNKDDEHFELNPSFLHDERS